MLSLWFSLGRDDFVSPFPIWILSLVLFTWMLWLGLPGILCWKESRHRCLVRDLRGKAVSFSPLGMIVTVDFLYGLYYVEIIFLLCPVWLFVRKGCLSNAFSASVEMTMLFLSFIWAVWYDIDRFSYDETSLTFQE